MRRQLACLLTLSVFLVACGTGEAPVADDPEEAAAQIGVAIQEVGLEVAKVSRRAGSGRGEPTDLALQLKELSGRAFTLARQSERDLPDGTALEAANAEAARKIAFGAERVGESVEVDEDALERSLNEVEAELVEAAERMLDVSTDLEGTVPDETIRELDNGRAELKAASAGLRDLP
ncbi:MAG: hypothetical protein ACR2NA_08030 [Solirubrobacterales bacterium]